MNRGKFVRKLLKVPCNLRRIYDTAFLELLQKKPSRGQIFKTRNFLNQSRLEISEFFNELIYFILLFPEFN